MTEKTFKPAALGEVRGPFKSSPGNPMPWQACYNGANGWVYFFARTPAAALNRAKDGAAKAV